VTGRRPAEPLRVANCSGFLGDRLAAAEEMVGGGPIDVLTGDWLAELTMGLLLRQRRRRPEAGYAATFLLQLEQVLGTCLERGVRIVANAGGVAPPRCAEAVAELAARLGLTARVAYLTGDDVTERFRELRAGGWPAPHLDTGRPLDSLGPGSEPEMANAYLGCWGIAEALAAGADVVVTGRVSDASVVAGPAAWRFGWKRDDWDALAGAVAAGHVIECGAQATGGNFSFFTEVPGLTRPGFPLAEVFPDGSSVITKHPGTGGAVTVETVTAQLLYEIDGPRYRNPDVVARFDTLALEPDGPDRVRISGTRGEPAPDRVKVGAICPGGYRNAMTFVLTGLDVEAKAELAQRAVWELIPGGADAFDEVDVRLLRADRPDPATEEEAAALLRVAVASRDEFLASRAFPAAVVMTGLASYPGFYCTDPPGRAREISVFWPTLLPAAEVEQRVVLPDREWLVAPTAASAPTPEPPGGAPAPHRAEQGAPHPDGRGGGRGGAVVRVALGRLVGARSGDKAGNATLGVWARDPAAHAWLAGWLTTERLRRLVPEAEGLRVDRWELPNLRAVGFTLRGLLGLGVAASLRLDAQAKGLGEYLRAKHVDVPADLVPSSAPSPVPEEKGSS
jgi:hypothetical protein